MSEHSKVLNNVVEIYESRISDDLNKTVLGTVEESLNAMLQAEVDALCSAQRYERNPDRDDTRAGHYQRQFHTKAGQVTLKMPKLHKQTFETATIDRYRRRKTLIEEFLVDMYLAGMSMRRVNGITDAL